MFLSDLGSSLNMDFAKIWIYKRTHSGGLVRKAVEITSLLSDTSRTAEISIKKLVSSQDKI